LPIHGLHSTAHNQIITIEDGFTSKKPPPHERVGNQMSPPLDGEEPGRYKESIRRARPPPREPLTEQGGCETAVDRVGQNDQGVNLRQSNFQSTENFSTFAAAAAAAAWMH
jgi:hypothetical protein